MNIVIVEDQAELSALIAEQLKKAGIRAECAASGEAALDLISPDVHDLVILDRGLPDMEGFGASKDPARGWGQNPCTRTDRQG